MTTTQRLRLGQLLVDARLITPEALADVLEAQKTDSRRLGTLLMEHGHISEVQLTQILSHQLSVPWVSLHKIEFSRQLLNLVPQTLAERHCLLPIYVRRVRGHGDTLYIAMDDPTNEEALRACAAYAGLPVRPMIAPPSDIRSAIRVYYGRPTAETEPPPAPADEPTKDAAPPPAAAAEAPPSAAAALEIAPAPAEAAPPAPAETASPAPEPTVAAGTDVAAAPAAGRPHSQTLRSAIFEEATRTEIQPDPALDDIPPIVRDSRPTPEPAYTTDDVRPRAKPREDDPVIEVAPLRPRSSELAAARATAIPAPRGKAPKMVSLTLLDGTTITLPAPRKKGSPEVKKVEAEEPAPESAREPHSTLTARDLVDALRAIASGADARTLLGEEVRWESMFAALLSTLLKKQIIADWEFVEELHRVQKR